MSDSTPLSTRLITAILERQNTQVQVKDKNTVHEHIRLKRVSSSVY